MFAAMIPIAMQLIQQMQQQQQQQGADGAQGGQGGQGDPVQQLFATIMQQQGG
jgi:hypothetical protein